MTQTVLFIICIIHVEIFLDIEKWPVNWCVFWHNQFVGAKNTYECPQGEIETDDQDDYENVETSFHQKEDSEDSENDYLNVDADKRIHDVDDDYEDEEIYANCVE